MKRHRIVLRAIRVRDIEAADLLADSEDDWREKAQRLQMRRWHKLKRSMKEVSHA